MAETVQPANNETVEAKFTVIEDSAKEAGKKFNPLAGNVERKIYARHSELPAIEIEEPVYANTPPIIEPVIEELKGNKNNNKSESHSAEPISEPKSERKEEKPHTSPGTPLSNTELEKTADEILKAYEAYYPQLFIADGIPWSPKFKKKTINNLISKNLINPNDIVQAKTIDEDTNAIVDVPLKMSVFFDEHNKAMNSHFAIKPQEKEALREPLIDVLRENDIQLTPTQRLLMNLGIQTGQRLVMCFQINSQNKAMLADFMKAHAERLEAINAQNELLRKNKEENERRQESGEEKSNETTQPKSDVKKPTLKEVIKKKKKS